MDMTNLIDVLSGLASGHLWNVSWQVCILAALALLAERMYRNAPPGFRYWLWMLVIVRLVVPLHISLTRTVYDPILDSIPLDATPLSGVVSPMADILTHARDQADLAGILGMAWLAGFLFILVYATVKAAGTHRLMAAGTMPVTRADLCELLERHAAGLGIQRKVGMIAGRGDAYATPVVIGILRPRIVLPRAIADTWETREIEPLIVHELIHIRRGDLLVNWFQILIHAAFFFHPVVWLANNRIRSAREEICDDLSVARLGGERERYSLSMIRVGEEFLTHRSTILAGAGFSEGNNRLGERIRRIMHGNHASHQHLTARSLIILGAVIVIAVMLSCDRSAVKSDRGHQTPLVIGIMDDTRVRLEFNDLVARADLERTLRQRLPLYDNKVVIFGKKDTPETLIEEIRKTARVAGAKDISYQAFSGEGIHVHILDDVTVVVNDTRVELSKIEKKFRELMPGNNYTVYISGRPDTSTETIGLVADTARRTGAKSIGMTPGVGKLFAESGKIMIRN